MFKNKVILLFRGQNQLQQRNMSHIGFVGIGNMGFRMATNLVKKGSKLKVYDALPAATQNLQGVQVCKTPKDAATDASVIITMLPDGATVKEVLLANDGILKGMKKNALLIDCSTIEPKTAQEIHKIAKENGIRFLDSPVSGGVTGAAAATLTYMIGGDKENLKDAEPVLLKAGARIFHCGGPGAGQIAKLCNNAILAATMAVTAEAMNMGIKLGLNAETLTQIINTSTGRSWTSETYNPVPGILPNVPSSNNYEGGFQVKLVAKDLNLAENAALVGNAPVPLTAAVHQLYRTMMSHGYANKDFSAVYPFLKGQQ